MNTSNLVRLRSSFVWIIAGISLVTVKPSLASPTTNSFFEPIQLTEDPTPGPWVNGVGNGFRPTAASVSITMGASAGIAAFGGRQRHDLALASFSYGHMLGPVREESHWYRGNWELRGELFTGEQFSPDQNWIVGLTPHLRYDFATGTRLVPFADVGAGVSATGIGPPDLSGTFEFNLQGTVGAHWFIRDNLAVTAEARYLHVSCAGIHSPNLGLNGVVGTVGLSWFF